MKHEQFVYWLQGFAELTPGQVPTKDQWNMIVEHLAECFDKVTPEFGHKVGHTGGYAGNKNFGLFGDTGAVCLAHAQTALSTRVADSSVGSAFVLNESSARADTGPSETKGEAISKAIRRAAQGTGAGSAAVC